MSLQVEIHQDFPQPLSQVFADLADHEKLGRILGAPMTRLVDGSGEGGVNGLGSVRRVGPPVLGFEETVKMTTEWYRAYYADPASIAAVTRAQIAAYSEAAAATGILWK